MVAVVASLCSHPLTIRAKRSKLNTWVLVVDGITRYKYNKTSLDAEEVIGNSPRHGVSLCSLLSSLLLELQLEPGRWGAASPVLDSATALESLPASVLPAS